MTCSRCNGAHVERGPNCRIVSTVPCRQCRPVQAAWHALRALWEHRTRHMDFVDWGALAFAVFVVGYLVREVLRVI